LDADGVLHGVKFFQRSASNTSFTGTAVSYTANSNQTVSAAKGRAISYIGFPFKVARLTYMSAVLQLNLNESRFRSEHVNTSSSATNVLVQIVAYSHKMNEVGGADQNLAAFRSVDGGTTFEFQQVVASRNQTNPMNVSGWEGPGENDLVRLKDGSLLAVFRVDSCHPYLTSRSTDGGVHWSTPNSLPFGSARPKLLLMPSGQPLLSGGRPGLWLWIGDITASVWTPINVAAVHNNLTLDSPTWQYNAGFVNGTAEKSGRPCEHALNETTVPRAGSTSYTSLLQISANEFMLQYDRLANGWAMPPGEWGEVDHTFSMRFSWVGS
jgi:hypothetical protein